MKKICSKCKTSKTIDNFYKDKRRKDGLSCWCRDCSNRSKVLSYRKNPQPYIKRIIAYHDKDPEKWRKYAKEYKMKLKREVMDKYGGKCKCCGEKELVFLTIDHINGGGNKHRKIIGKNIYVWLKKNNYPKGFQVLCWNCNAAKHILGKCPHKN